MSTFINLHFILFIINQNNTENFHLIIFMQNNNTAHIILTGYQYSTPLHGTFNISFISVCLC